MPSTKEKLLNELLCFVNKATTPENIKYFFEYYLKQEKICKPIYNLFADSFLSIHSYTVLTFNRCWSQAGAILRTAIEQISTLTVLVNNEQAMKDYLALDILKRQYYQIEDEEECEKFVKEHNLPKDDYSRKAYFDYSWIRSITKKPKFSYKDIVKEARLDEVLGDIDVVLNKFVHGKLTIFDFAGPDGSWDVMKKYGRRANMICAKLFDFVCCSYKKFTNEPEVTKVTNNLFIPFKNLYLKCLEKK